MFFNNVSPACQRHSGIEESSSLNSFALNSKNPDLLKTKGTAAQDRVQPALAVVVASSLIVSSFPSINSIFSHAWHFLFLKRQFMKSSLIPRMSITDIWRAKLPAAKCQVSHVQKKKKKMLCVILSCVGNQKKRNGRVMRRLILCVPTSGDNTGALAEGHRPPVGGHRSCHSPKGQRKG